jgi:hypothetical protein
MQTGDGIRIAYAPWLWLVAGESQLHAEYVDYSISDPKITGSQSVRSAVFQAVHIDMQSGERVRPAIEGGRSAHDHAIGAIENAFDLNRSTDVSVATGSGNSHGITDGEVANRSKRPANRICAAASVEAAEATERIGSYNGSNRLNLARRIDVAARPRNTGLIAYGHIPRHRSGRQYVFAARRGKDTGTSQTI